MNTPEIGLHFDIPESVYRSWPAVCQSDLGHVCNGKTLAHAYQAKMHPDEPTPAMHLGTGIHKATLEPDTFEDEWVARPAIDRRTKKGKIEWKAFEEEHGTKEILPADDFDRCLEIREAVWRNPLIAEILGGERYVEVCPVWEDPETGTLCKARIDVLTTFGHWTVLGDLKSTNDASAKGFAKSVANFGYHRQATFYLDGMNALDPRERLFLFLAIEKEPPYCSAVYELDYESAEKGRREYQHALAQWAEAEESGLWPGYPTEVQTLELPRWAMSYSEEATI